MKKITKTIATIFAFIFLSNAHAEKFENLFDGLYMKTAQNKYIEIKIKDYYVTRHFDGNEERSNRNVSKYYCLEEDATIQKIQKISANSIDGFILKGKYAKYSFKIQKLQPALVQLNGTKVNETAVRHCHILNSAGISMRQRQYETGIYFKPEYKIEKNVVYLLVGAGITTPIAFAN